MTLRSVAQARFTAGRPARGRGAITRHVMAVAGLLRQDRLTIGDLFARLGPEGLGLALLLLSLPTLLPVPGPIGMTFGTLIALVAIQIMAGARMLWLPPPLCRRTLPGSSLRSVIARALPALSWAERWLREQRMAFLTGRRARAALALPLLLLAVAIILPIPFGNTAPALALIAFSLGFMARDGAMVLVALVFSVAALAWTGLLFVVGAAIVEKTFGLFGASG